MLGAGRVVERRAGKAFAGQQVPRGKPLEVRGIAWDGGSGIAKVEASTDGSNWAAAKLGKELGRYSFREFALTVPT